MVEVRLQGSSYPSTFEFHKDRERAPHLEQPWHANRLYIAAKMARSVSPKSIVDLGCGDGGLLSLVKDIPSWGYDFCPANQAGWVERGVTAEFADVFNTDFEPKWAELVVVTEVLEHLADPHGAVEWIARNAKFIVASSPFDDFGEHGPGMHEHVWAWDYDGYAQLLGEHFSIIQHRRVDWSQIYLGRSLYA
jgi:SAM-dependent methyltransferase